MMVVIGGGRADGSASKLTRGEGCGDVSAELGGDPEAEVGRGEGGGEFSYAT